MIGAVDGWLAGETVISLPDGAVGLAAFATAEPPVVRRQPGTAVVQMSGYTEVATRDGAAEPGRHMLAKPFRKRELARIVREALAARTS